MLLKAIVVLEFGGKDRSCSLKKRICHSVNVKKVKVNGDAEDILPQREQKNSRKLPATSCKPCSPAILNNTR
ncbi:hypothetical protein DXN05_02275 [Deminuibacter soli]|uniref:Uncharacterized protein n=1 Tax=Deminuibacter soli TaxID=2291815 RepID=A0A3E1NPG3_9BACT|nr:hypothetical protein DXN05_02275 [Deminuibacter soli]